MLIPSIIDKSGKLSKLGKGTKFADKLDDICDAGTLVLKSLDDIDELADILIDSKKVLGKIDITHLDDVGLKGLLTKLYDANIKDITKYLDSDQLVRLFNSTDDISKLKAIVGDLSDPNVI